MIRKPASPEFLRDLLMVSKHWLLIIGLVTGVQISLLGGCTNNYHFEAEVEDPNSSFETVEGGFEGTIDPIIIPPREPSDCPGLDSQLYQLIHSEKPQLSASQIGMNVKEDKIQVLIILESEETGFLRDYEVELGTQSGNQIQAYVPFDRLCELANLNVVLAIRPVDMIYP